MSSPISPPPLRLIRVLRLLFGVFRGVAALVLVLWLIQIVFLPFMPRRNGEQKVATVDFAASSLPIQIAPKDPSDTKAVIRLLHGDIKIVESGETVGGFERVTRTSLLASRGVHWVCWYILCHLLWRLFQNLERREIFSPRNLVLVRRLGVTLVVYSFAGLIVDLWRDWRIGRYLADHFTFTGAHAFTETASGGLFSQFFSAYMHYANFDDSMFLIGMLVFVVAEVFRRGLALQEETDLTV